MYNDRKQERDLLQYTYFDRKLKKILPEKIYGKMILSFLLKNNPLSAFLYHLSGRCAWISYFYGKLQKTQKSRKKIQSFIEEFNVDSSEFQKQNFDSFNDFFIRKLKPETRPIRGDEKTVIMPADGRYLVFPDLSKSKGIWVKGQFFSLEKLLQDHALAQKYAKGSLAIIRLCPSDYHRFHFPFDCRVSEPQLMNGTLYSVNPLILKKNIEILAENKRMRTGLSSEIFGNVQMIEVGATNVGSIHQTYLPKTSIQKGEEKGYFSFGGSCILLLFEPNKIQFDQDLIEYSQKGIEVRGLWGDTLAQKI